MVVDDKRHLTPEEISDLRDMLKEYQHRKWAIRQVWIFGGIVGSVIATLSVGYTAIKAFIGTK